MKMGLVWGPSVQTTTFLGESVVQSEVLCRTPGPQWPCSCVDLQDDYPLASLPLLGYSVSLPREADSIHKDYVFKLQFKSHVYFFRAESKYTFERWFCHASFVCCHSLSLRQISQFLKTKGQVMFTGVCFQWYVHVYMCAYIQWPKDFWSLFFLSCGKDTCATWVCRSEDYYVGLVLPRTFMWVLGIEFRLPGLHGKC